MVSIQPKWKKHLLDKLDHFLPNIGLKIAKTTLKPHTTIKTLIICILYWLDNQQFASKNAIQPSNHQPCHHVTHHPLPPSLPHHVTVSPSSHRWPPSTSSELETEKVVLRGGGLAGGIGGGLGAAQGCATKSFEGGSCNWEKNPQPPLPYMDVSENSGTLGFSIINHPFWGTPILGNTQIFLPSKHPSSSKNIHEKTPDVLEVKFNTHGGWKVLSASKIWTDGIDRIYMGVS